MAVEFLFNSSGDWIAFRVDKWVYDTDGNPVGWLPWEDNYVITPEGEYLGSICPGRRLYKLAGQPSRGYPGYPGDPGYPGNPGHPGHAGYSPLPPGAEDSLFNRGG